MNQDYITSSCLSMLSKKGLTIAHLNICSLRNKTHEIVRICTADNIQVLALSETHLDSTMSNSELMINGYKLYRKDRDRYGGGVAFYIKENYGVILRNDLMNKNIEAIWVQISVPHCKPILVGCCYRPPSANVQYLDSICESMDRATDENKDMFLLGDFNIDWFAKTCSLTKKLSSMAEVCNLTQMVTQPTRIGMKTNCVCTSSCIDLIFTNIQDLCSKAVSVAVGCSDHNLIALTKKTKIPKLGSRIILSRAYKRFNQDLFINEVQSVQWSEVCQENDVNIALNTFMDIITKIVDKHAPIIKKSVKVKNAPWLDDDLRSLMLQRDMAKYMAQKSGSHFDKQFYCKLRNRATKLNYIKKREYYNQKIRCAAGDTKKTWKVLNEIMCRKTNNLQGYV
ncbi:MAG: endonuclease/exonuclease/phosphatase family protein [Paraclostridium sp.]